MNDACDGGGLDRPCLERAGVAERPRGTAPAQGSIVPRPQGLKDVDLGRVAQYFQQRPRPNEYATRIVWEKLNLMAYEYTRGGFR